VRAMAWMVLGTLAAVAASGCASGTGGPAPAARGAAGGSDIKGRFVWHDLVTRDVAACRRFYGALLDWEFTTRTRNGRPYLVARSGGRFVGGFVERGEQTGAAAWLAYLAVDDLEQALAQVRAAGGEVLLPSTPMSTYGHVAVVRDPQGAPLGLAAVTAELPPEPQDPPLRRFFWMEYLAKDVPAALAFYQELAGYDSRVRVTERGTDYVVLRRQRSRAGLLRLPPQLAAVEPNWLPYVRVEDPAALAARVQALGGRVVLAPQADLRRGTLAVVADPTGGVFALQRWPI
jgi:uncharacterized protein